MDILVAYGSKYGSTRGIAEQIGQTLSAAGHTVTVQPAKRVKGLSSYQGIVLGGGIYVNRLHSDVRKLVARLPGDLAPLKRAAFAVCMSACEEDTEIRARSEAYLDGIKDIFRPDHTAIFAGAMDLAQMNWFMRYLLTKMSGKTADARDWDAIKAWAQELSASWAD